MKNLLFTTAATYIIMGIGFALLLFRLHSLELHVLSLDTKIKELESQSKTESCTLPGETCTWQVHP